MIAKIGRSSNLYGALAYNNKKVEREKGKILMINKMIETTDGKYTVSQLAHSFDSYLAANRNTEKYTLHISLNPDPKDEVSDESFIQMAEDYMQKLGYGDQPYVVFKHLDIKRTHIHIVSLTVDEMGKKISDRFEKRRINGDMQRIGKQIRISACYNEKRSKIQLDLSSCRLQCR